MEAWRDELYHHGIKGQEWGVRRFQNEDRTWTEAGKRRYEHPTGGRRKRVRNRDEKLRRMTKAALVVGGTALAAYGGYRLYKSTAPKVSNAVKLTKVNRNFTKSLREGEKVAAKMLKTKIPARTLKGSVSQLKSDYGPMIKLGKDFATNSRKLLTEAGKMTAGAGIVGMTISSEINKYKKRGEYR